MTVKDDVEKELSKLIEEGATCEYSFSKAGPANFRSSVPESKLRAFATRAYAAVERITGRDSVYYRSLPPIESKRRIGVASASGFIPTVNGCLSGLLADVQDGLLEKLESRIRAQVHDDFLLQAKDLIASGYHVAAMVLVGGVLEDHLAKLCGKYGLPISGSGSITKYNDACYKKPLYDVGVMRRVQGIGDERNKAAHGQGTEVKKEDVEDACKYTERFLADYLA